MKLILQRFFRMRIGMILPMFLPILAGCVSRAGTGVKWYAPATWFSHSAATAVDNAQKKEDAVEKTALKAAQKSSHETQIALAAAPAGKAVAIATDSNAITTGLLDQVAGAPTAAELASAKTTVVGLMSDDPAVRNAAERERDTDTARVIDISAKLTAAQAETRTVEEKLRSAFERENALANELRSAKALHWIFGTLFVLAALGWAYVRIFLGGIPGALGGALAKLETRNPGAAEELRTVLDTYMNRHEQDTVRSAYLKSR